jgi:hypothetical protein
MFNLHPRFVIWPRLVLWSWLLWSQRFRWKQSLLKVNYLNLCLGVILGDVTGNGRALNASQRNNVPKRSIQRVLGRQEWRCSQETKDEAGGILGASTGTPRSNLGVFGEQERVLVLHGKMLVWLLLPVLHLYVSPTITSTYSWIHVCRFSGIVRVLYLSWTRVLIQSTTTTTCSLWKWSNFSEINNETNLTSYLFPLYELQRETSLGGNRILASIPLQV